MGPAWRTEAVADQGGFGQPQREEWDAEGQTYETLAICRTLAQARAVLDVVTAEKPAGRVLIRSRTRVVQRHPQGDW